ncbi:YncE family protein [Williamsia sterculiae]|uniref:DNA-binding beta-propeller fold protein YncE n=1 Tax=Williamsia sterculiae TaxID=1344003 RepID=A0A1N7EXZ3_9NOCA|nr:hypothetical protein [Williamsia sterculiae]SIR92978.1 DNA-binding beta-propeller fold protein YncE [Williamsia sterculiae]
MTNETRFRRRPRRTLSAAVSRSRVDDRPDYVIGETVGSTSSLALRSPVSDWSRSPDGRYLYLLHVADGSVSVVDMVLNRVVRHGVGVNAAPQGIAVSADGSIVYVVDRDDQSIRGLDVTDFSAARTLPCPDDHAPSAPESLVVSTDGTRLSVVYRDVVRTIDLQTGLSADGPVTVHYVRQHPRVIAVEGDAFLIYEASGADLEVHTPRTADPHCFTVIFAPADIAFVPNPARVYATVPKLGVLSVDLDDCDYEFIDVRPEGRDNDAPPAAVAVSADGTLAAVRYQGSPRVTIVDTAVDTVIMTVTLPAVPARVALSSDGSRLFAVSDDPRACELMVLSLFAVAGTVLYGGVADADVRYELLTHPGAGNVTMDGETGDFTYTLDSRGAATDFFVAIVRSSDGDGAIPVPVTLPVGVITPA